MREDLLPGYLRDLKQVYPLEMHERAADVDDAGEYAEVDERAREGDSGFSDWLCGEFALEFPLLRVFQLSGLIDYDRRTRWIIVRSVLLHCHDRTGKERKYYGTERG